MYSANEYTRNCTKYVKKMLQVRVQSYDRWGQLYSITLSPSIGSKLPFMAKFPHTTSLFRKIPPGHQQPFLRENSDGLFNGLYFIPCKISPEEMMIKPVKTNHLDLNAKLQASPRLHLLKEAFKDIQKNLVITNHGEIGMEVEEDCIDFRSQQNLLQNGEYSRTVSIHTFVMYCPKLIHN